MNHLATSTGFGPTDGWVNGNDDDIAYDAFLARVNARFAATTQGKPVFNTSASLYLWGTYLYAFPSHERQVHNCNACRHFIERFGSLAVIGDNGKLTSALWDEGDAAEGYRDAVRDMRQLVESARVTGVFISDEKMLGQPKTGKWVHLHAKNPAVFNQRGRTAYQEQSEKREDYLMVQRALHDYIPRHVNIAVTLLESEALYRAEKVLGPAKWLQQLQASLPMVSGNARTNLVWRAIATAPAGFAHIRSSMIGTLLDDIAAEKPMDEVRRAFAAKMKPTVYQRPQAAPAAGNIAAAERAFAELGLAPALERRFARLDEIVAVWRPAAQHGVSEQAVGALFGHLQPKKAAPKLTELPAQTMTWTKFARTVLPDAVSIEYAVPSHGGFAAILTAVHRDAPPILQWDSEQQRNPFSWYVYGNGSRAAQWGLNTGWTKVDAVTLKPSMWHGEFEHQGNGVIFVLHGAADSREAGNALFPETLRREMHPYRATIEAYSRDAKIQGRALASASGIMLAGNAAWSARLRVTTRDSVREISLDRWD